MLYTSCNNNHRDYRDYRAYREEAEGRARSPVRRRLAGVAARCARALGAVLVSVVLSRGWSVPRLTLGPACARRTPAAASPSSPVRRLAVPVLAAAWIVDIALTGARIPLPRGRFRDRIELPLLSAGAALFAFVRLASETAENDG